MASEPVWDVYETGFVTSEDLALPAYSAATRNGISIAKPRTHGSETIKRLLATYHTASPQLNTWGFAKQVVDAAVIKFGPSPARWFGLQYALNDRVHSTNLAFLNDTLGYIVSGKRDIQLETWRGMIVRNPARIAGVANDQRQATFAAVLASRFGGRPDAATFYRQWLGYKDGLVDLLLTLDILFGETALPVRQEPQGNSAKG